jgi:hypothetical protein
MPKFTTPSTPNSTTADTSQTVERLYHGGGAVSSQRLASRVDNGLADSVCDSVEALLLASGKEASSPAVDLLRRCVIEKSW